MITEIAAKVTTHANTKVTPVSSCVNAADPDQGINSGCQCSGYTGFLPVLPGTSGCRYTAVTGSPALTTTTSKQTKGFIGYPFTSTAGNGRIVAYQTTTNMGEGPIYTGSSTLLYSGKHMSVVQTSKASVNVGTLTGDRLYTAVSDALMSGCTSTPAGGPHGTITKCGHIPKVTGIVWADSTGDWGRNAELELSIQWINYYDLRSLKGMIASLASVLKSNSLNPANIWKPPRQQCNPLCVGTSCPYNTTNVPGWVGITYSQDTVSHHLWPDQQLFVNLAVKTSEGSPFLCADGALIMDGLAALALFPEFEWLSFLAIPALGASATCAGIEPHDSSKGFFNTNSSVRIAETHANATLLD